MMLHALLAVSLPIAWGTSPPPSDPAVTWANVRGKISELLGKGLSEEGIRRLAQAIEAARDRGETGPLVARALNDLGSLYQDMNRLPDSERCYADAIKILDLHRDSTSIRIVVQANLAALRVRQARYAEAERLYRDVERLAAADVNTNRDALATVYGGLAEVAFSMGRYGDARRLAQRLLAVVERGEEARGGAFFLLARVAAEQRKTKDAEILLRRALREWEFSVGAGHPNYAAGLAGLAVLLSGKQPGDSEELFRQALEIAVKNFGVTHPYYAQILLQYSGHLDSRGRTKEANDLKRTAERTLSDQSLRNRLGHTVDVHTLRTR